MRRTAGAARRVYALLAALVGVAGIAFVAWQLLTSAGILGGGASPAPSIAPSAVAGEIFLEPVDTVGPDPFTTSVALPDPAPTPVPSASPSPLDTPTTSPSTVDVTVITGGTVGLYGGSTNDRVCDRAQMIAFLEESPVKAAAWAGVQGIEVAQIRPYLESLTPVRLRRDTRVTNHGFRDGVAVPRQSVLQAGTAVLVDDRGVPRARCFCGNPLAEPRPVPTQPSYTGQRWPSFDPRAVTAISPAPAPLPAIPVVDPTTGDVVDRPIGSDGSAVGPSPSAATPPPTPSPTPPPTITPTPSAAVGPGDGQPVARAPAFPSDITPLGAVGATSVDPNFPVGSAVDLDVTTSWFSRGPHQADTITDFTWSLSGPTAIGGVAIYHNGQNVTPEFRQGFGFGQVVVEIVHGGTVVSTTTLPLDGTPDPIVVVTLPPGTTGDTVRLRFSGHESLDCGGVGEVLVLGPDWQAERDAIAGAGYGWLFGG